MNFSKMLSLLSPQAQKRKLVKIWHVTAQIMLQLLASPLSHFFFIHKNDRSFFKYTKTTAIYEISYKGRKKIQPPMTFVSVVHTKAKGYLWLAAIYWFHIQSFSWPFLNIHSIKNKCVREWFDIYPTWV